MIHKKQGDLKWLEFDLLSQIPELVHGVFLRHGGVSQGPFGSLNTGGGSGDDPRNVLENRRRILQALKVENYVTGTQVHGRKISWVKEPNQQIGECDGLITDCRNLGLMVRHADCQAAIFYDPKNKAVANVHSGWRGNVKNIYRSTIQKMRRVFGSKPADLLVCISPSLGPDCAEFIHYKAEFPEDFWAFQIKPYYFNLWAIARYQLELSGILPHHIEIAEICTNTEVEDYFSYRREKVSGRHATLAMLKDC